MFPFLSFNSTLKAYLLSPQTLKSDSGISSTLNPSITSIVSDTFNKIFQELSRSEIFISFFQSLSVDLNLKALYHSNVVESNSFLLLSANNNQSQLTLILKS
ncbi:MAG: hypothetical protein LBQ24_06625 [Candidatus Peribacteria bacterium]|jgi:hypothetical protein|nr:hypothetical protein [Candidatus Peribacteria bacterium]